MFMPSELLVMSPASAASFTTLWIVKTGEVDGEEDIGLTSRKFVVDRAMVA